MSDELKEYARRFAAALDGGDDAQAKAIFIDLLQMGGFEAIAQTINGVLINRQFKNTGAELAFEVFIDTAKRLGLDEKQYNPVLFASLSAPKNTFLRKLSASFEAQMLQLARTDFDCAAKLVERDGGIYGYSVLLKADCERAALILLDKLINQKNADRTAIRRLIGKYKPDIVPRIADYYKSKYADVRQNAVRLLLLYSTDALAARILEDAQNDRSKAVRALVAGGAARNAYGGGGITARLENDMVCGTLYEFSVFKKTVLKSKKGADAASGLFFIHLRDGERSVIVYDEGQFFDLNNVLFEIKAGDLIGVLHPADIVSEQAFIKMLTIEQPFLQVKRPVYRMGDNERSYNFCNRLNGTVTTLKELKSNMQSCGFFILNKSADGECASIGTCIQDTVCVIYFNPVSFDGAASTHICVQGIRFFNSGAVSALNKRLYLDASSPLDIGILPQRLFSELIYSSYKVFSIV